MDKTSDSSELRRALNNALGLSNAKETKRILDDLLTSTGAARDAEVLRVVAKLFQEIDNPSVLGRAALEPVVRILDSCDALTEQLNSERDGVDDYDTVVRSAIDYGLYSAAVLHASALQDVSVAAAVSLSPHIAYWRQRDGPGSILLAALGPFRAFFHAKAANGLARSADMFEAGPFDWMYGVYWGVKEACKFALSSVWLLDFAPIRTSATAVMAAGGAAYRSFMSTSARWLCGVLESRRLFAPVWLLGMAYPIEEGQDSADAAVVDTSQIADGLASTASAALSRALRLIRFHRCALPSWLQPLPLPHRLMSPAAKADALTSLQRPLLVLAGLATKTLPAAGAAHSVEDLDSLFFLAGNPICDVLMMQGASQPPPSPASTDDGSPSPSISSSAASSSCISYQSRIALLRSMCERTAQLSSWVDAAARPYYARSAVQRNWLLWAALGTAAYTGVTVLPQHADDVRGWLRDTMTSVGSFYNEHMRTPLSRMAGELLGTEPVPHVADADALALARSSLADMLRDFHHRMPAASLPDDLRQADLDTLAAALDMRPVTEAFTRQIRTPVRSAVSGDLVELMLIQIAFLKKEMLAATAALDQILLENRFNFQVMATIPALLVIYASGRGASALYRAATAPIDTGDIRGRMRMTLRDAHRLLTLADDGSTGASSEASEQQRLSFSSAERAGVAELWRRLLPAAAALPLSGPTEGAASLTSSPSSSSVLSLEQSGLLVALTHELLAQLTAYRQAHPIGWEEWQRMSQDVHVSSQPVSHLMPLTCCACSIRPSGIPNASIQTPLVSNPRYLLFLSRALIDCNAMHAGPGQQRPLTQPACCGGGAVAGLLRAVLERQALAPAILQCIYERVHAYVHMYTYTCAHIYMHIYDVYVRHSIYIQY